MKDFDTYLKETGEVGYVQSIMSSIFYVSGLPNVRLNELVLTENGLIGIVKAVLSELVEVMVFEGQTLIHNMKVVRTNEFFQVPVSDAFLGRVVDPFGVAQDSLQPIEADKLIFREVDPPAPPMTARAKVTRPFTTGVMAVDMQIPLGHGQRELVLGDQKTGKTIFALQTMVDQARQGTICIYVSCGKKKSDLKFVQNYLSTMKILDKTVIVSASSSDPAPMVYLAPFSGMSVAEHFRDMGHDVLVVLDDMTTHAKFYREISLLSRRPPGRQSYPGDIFHLHAKIAERAGNIKLANGKEAAITLLPIAETLEGDLTGYIQTNLMAMTDGHLFFDISESKRGRLPAVSFTLSVSRVGNQTKTSLEREISSSLTISLTEARKAEELGRFGIELSKETMAAIAKSVRIEALFKQDGGEIIPKQAQIIFAGLFMAGFWDKAEALTIRLEKQAIIAAYNAGYLDKIRLSLSKLTKLSEIVAFFKTQEVGVRQIIEKVQKTNEYKGTNKKV